MDEQLRKRLDGAIKETLNCDNCACKEIDECMGTSMCPLYRHALKCAKQGYIEAIKQAKEWMKKRCEELSETYGVSFNLIDFDAPFSLTDFENDMNKLWEEQK